jgi:hypothetical protein
MPYAISRLHGGFAAGLLAFMKTPFCLAGLAICAVLTLSSCSSDKAPPAETSAESDGFIELFNGKDLSGWTPSEENPESFSVENGILIVKGGKSHLFYTGDVNGGKFKDFEVKARVKTMPGANGGIYFHTAQQGEGWPEQGFECQVNSTHKDPKKTGSLYGVRNIVVLQEGQEPPKGGESEVREKAPSTDGEWFDYHITVKGKRILIQVNGETTVDYTEPEGGPGVDGSPGRKLSEGTFGIQAHDPDSETNYERFAVKPL